MDEFAKQIEEEYAAKRRAEKHKAESAGSDEPETGVFE